MAGGLHRVVPRQLRRAWSAAPWRLYGAAQSLSERSRGAELLPADDPGAHLPRGRVRLDLRARRRGEAVAGQGIRFGIAVICLTTVPLYLIYYVVQPMPGATVAKQIVFDGILVLILGAIVAFMYRRPA